jgi:hypothetical protein
MLLSFTTINAIQMVIASLTSILTSTFDLSPGALMKLRALKEPNQRQIVFLLARPCSFAVRLTPLSFVCGLCAGQDALLLRQLRQTFK